MNKQVHLEAVSDFINLDFNEDKDLLDIIELASTVTQSPYALITFVKDDQQNIRVKKGIKEKEISRQLNFFASAVMQHDLLLVPDVLKDERFLKSEIINDPDIRFYAGVPLITNNGQKIGTLCVFDIKGHNLDDQQQQMLKILANQVMKIIELRVGVEMLQKKEKELLEQKKFNDDASIRLRSFFESSTNFQILLGKGGEVIDFNKSSYNFIKGVHKAELKRGDKFIKYLDPAFVSTYIDRYNDALEGKKTSVEGSTDYDQLGIVYWEATFEAARNNNNEIIGVSYLIRNITERKLKEQKILSQNKSLLKIAHIQAHEFRAPLSTIMGLMNLIKEEDYNPPVEYIKYLEQAVDTLDVAIRQIVTDIDGSVIQNNATELN